MTSEQRIAAFVDFFRSLAEKQMAALRDLPAWATAEAKWFASFFEAVNLPSDKNPVMQRIKKALVATGKKQAKNVPAKMVFEQAFRYGALSDLFFDLVVLTEGESPEDNALAVWWAPFQSETDFYDGQAEVADGEMMDVRPVVKGMTDRELEEAAIRLEEIGIAIDTLPSHYSIENVLLPKAVKRYIRRHIKRPEGKEATRDSLLFSRFSVVVTPPGWQRVAFLRPQTLYDALRPYVEHPAEPDDVVYRYAGTNDTPAGASSRGMYVAKLRSNQLKKEGIDLGICVGDAHYHDLLFTGEATIYSIRTEARAPKFTVDIRNDDEGPRIKQIKGKANRIPGFEPDTDDFTKPDEVRLVVEFLMFLGFTPDQIRNTLDIRAGVKAMLENGVDPFAPPPVRSRKKAAENPAFAVSPKVAALARADYEEPWGGVWGTGDDAEPQENPYSSEIWLQYRAKIAEHEMAAAECRRAARYDLEALADARWHEAEAARLEDELAMLRAEAAAAPPPPPDPNVFVPWWKRPRQR